MPLLALAKVGPFGPRMNNSRRQKPYDCSLIGGLSVGGPPFHATKYELAEFSGALSLESCEEGKVFFI